MQMGKKEGGLLKPREILNRRKNTYFIIVGISFLIMAMLAYLEQYLAPSSFRMISIGAITTFTLGVILLYMGIRCPKCKAILGLKYVFAEETLSRCHRCGINFDEDSL